MKTNITMKHISILVTLLLMAAVSTAQNKKFDKLIKEFDVKEYVKDLDRDEPKLFWEAVFRNNKTLNKLLDAIDKKKKSANQAKMDLYYSKKVSSEYLDNLPLVDELQDVTDTLAMISGIKEVYPAAEIHVTFDNEENAFTNPDGRIFFTSGLVMNENISDVGLLGICAHEITHFVLQHSMTRAYAYRRKENKNKVIAGIAATVTIATNAYAQANGAAGEESWENVEKINANLFEDVGKNANKYRYKYSREQELEADIIAYRFLEWMGLGGENYINALKALGYEDEISYDDESDHPTVRFRVELLEYLSKQP